MLQPDLRHRIMYLSKILLAKPGLGSGLWTNLLKWRGKRKAGGAARKKGPDEPARAEAGEAHFQWVQRPSPARPPIGIRAHTNEAHRAPD
jgi:hypothetical protein